MNGALSKGAGEKKGEQSREIGLVQGVPVKISKLEKGWAGAREGRKGKQSNSFTYLGRQVKDEGWHYLEELTNRLALRVNISQRRGPFLERRGPQCPEFLGGCPGVLTEGAGIPKAGVSWVLAWTTELRLSGGTRT